MTPKNLKAVLLGLTPERLADYLLQALDELEYVADQWAQRNVSDYNPARHGLRGLLAELVREVCEGVGLYHCTGCNELVDGKTLAISAGAVAVVCEVCEAELVSADEVDEQRREARADRQLSEGVR